MLNSSITKDAWRKSKSTEISGEHKHVVNGIEGVSEPSQRSTHAHEVKQDGRRGKGDLRHGKKLGKQHIA